MIIVVVVLSLSHVWFFATPQTASCQDSLSFTISRVCTNSCSLHRWWHQIISSSITPFSSCLHQDIFQWVSFLHQVANALELQHHSFQWIFKVDFLKDWVVWSPCSPRDLSQVFSSIPIRKHQFFNTQLFFMVQLSHPYKTIGKTIALTIQIFVGKEMALLLIHCLHLSQLSRSKHLLISWLQSPLAVILQPKNIKSVTISTFSLFYLPWSDGIGCYDLHFQNAEF